MADTEKLQTNIPIQCTQRRRLLAEKLNYDNGSIVWEFDNTTMTVESDS